jgi:protein-serine/threonine kinase
MSDPAPGPSSSPNSGYTQQSQQETNTNSPSKPRGENYVYVERSTAGFSSDAVAHSTAAKLKLESYYKVAVDAAIERNTRCVLQCVLSIICILDPNIESLDESNWNRS